ncbi:MAG: FG-GAP-like repeat-containing protein [Proteobacteria bacterium]|nr:FG-GAP-like repeat-containing protein [Pseudomonadota bacterium]
MGFNLLEKISVRSITRLLIFRWRRSLFAGIIIILIAPISASSQTDPRQAAAVNYVWEQQYYGELNGVKSLMFSHEMRHSKLAFADIDDDGDQDIFLGQDNGEIAFFENRGTAENHQFVLLTQQYKAIFEIKKEGRKVKIRNTIDVGARSAPALVDIDHDGDFDLFIGSQQGNIWFFENQGNNLVPEFKLVTPRYSNIEPGQNSVPIFADVNLKRKYDLLVGTVDGKVWLYMNEGTRIKADFLRYPPELVVEFGLETHASPALFDWDLDGDLDLVVGQKNGTLSLFLNEGDRFFPKWVLAEQSFQLIDIGGESAPYFVDIDNDNDSDLIVGSANPTVFHYENRLQAGKRVLWNKSTNLFLFHKLIVTGHRASIAVGDLDADGDFDIIVGERRGNLNYYENQGDSKNPNWVLKTEELIFMTGVENSAPALGDIDGDGDLDLLVGEKAGQIIFVKNIGTAKKAEWELNDKTYFQIDAGSNSVPYLVDLDQDKDLDLLIGNYAGRIIFFKNKGTAEEPVFALESTRFANAKVTRNAAPALFDWNEDKFLDMIVGSEEGNLQLLMSPGKADLENPVWQADDNALFSFDMYALSHPLLHDFNADGLKDLLVGNDFGDFVLYINKGKEVKKTVDEGTLDNSIDQQDGSLVVEEVEGRVDIDLEQEAIPEETIDFETTAGITLIEQPVEKVKVDPNFSSLRQLLIRNDRINKSVPTFGDLDFDGDLDLLIGSRSGRIYHYENIGSELQWNFQLNSDDYLPDRERRNTAPILHDIDQDGDLDLVIGSKTGKIYLYLNQGSSEEPNFIAERSLFNNLWLGQNSKPSVVDLDSDGLLDLLVGTFNGKLIHIRNDSSRFNIIRRDYHQIDVDLGSTPFFVDLSNAEQQDLMIGSDSGKVTFLRNEKPNLQGNWAPITKIKTDLQFPRGSSPVAYDLDADGDVDLVTGSESGPVYLYLNEAIVREDDDEMEDVFSTDF